MLQHTDPFSDVNLDISPPQMNEDRWIKGDMQNTCNEGDRLMIISYLADTMVVIERINRINGKLTLDKKLIYYLTHTKGRIDVAVIISILRFHDGEFFSLNKLKDTVDQEYFLPYRENVSSSIINNTIKRMLRSTLRNFYQVDGQTIKRHNFSLYINILHNKIGDEIDYHYYKFRIENYRDKIINELEKIKNQ